MSEPNPMAWAFSPQGVRGGLELVRVSWVTLQRQVAPKLRASDHEGLALTRAQASVDRGHALQAIGGQ